LGPARDTGVGEDEIKERVPRNSPAIFNLGAKEFRVMFPMTSATEMAGQKGENDVANASVADELPALWDLIGTRLRNIPEYCDLFAEAYGRRCKDVTYVDAANAIAAFEAKTWRSDDSPFDRYLRKDSLALGGSGSDAMKGKDLFYGKAHCSRCHRGKFQTDQRFHAVAMPQIGPGKGDGLTGHEDFGRERVTGLERHRYRLRTPTLRNIELTAPYGHAGAFATLKAMIRHHADPEKELFYYDREQAVLPSRRDLDAIDSSLFDEADQPAIHEIFYAANLDALPKRRLADAEVDQLVAFLKSLTGDRSRDLEGDIPEHVPSGLPVNEEGLIDR